MTDTNNKLKCDHCGKDTVYSSSGLEHPSIVAWCGSCTNEDWELIKKINPGVKGKDTLWQVSFDQIKAIPKKQAKTHNKCDHCGKKTSCLAAKETDVIWCASCNKEDGCLLEALNLDGAVEPVDQLWIDPKNTAKIKTVPKREAEEIVWPKGDWKAYPPCGHCGERRGQHHSGHCNTFQGKARNHSINNSTPLYIRGSAEPKKENGQRFTWTGIDWVIEPVKVSDTTTPIELSAQPKTEPIYNVWMVREGRWTNGVLSHGGGVYQNSTHPIALTYEQARAQADFLGDGILWDPADVEVRELLPNGMSGKAIPKQEKIFLTSPQVEEPKTFVQIDLSVKPLVRCDHCDKELSDCKLDPEQIAWCNECAKENATELAKQNIPYFGDGGTGYVKWSANASKIRAIPKKGVKLAEPIKENSKPYTVQCDHCDKQVPSDFTLLDNQVAWCNECIEEDKAKLEAAGVPGIWPHTYNHFVHWSDSAPKLKSIPKRGRRTNCCVCAIECKDWGCQYNSVCRECASTIQSDTWFINNGNGYLINDPIWNEKIEAAKKQHAEKQKAEQSIKQAAEETNKYKQVLQIEQDQLMKENTELAKSILDTVQKIAARLEKVQDLPKEEIKQAEKIAETVEKIFSSMNEELHKTSDKVPCVICSVECTNWNKDYGTPQYHCACAQHASQIKSFRDGGAFLEYPDGFLIGQPSSEAAIARVKKKWIEAQQKVEKEEAVAVVEQAPKNRFVNTCDHCNQQATHSYSSYDPNHHIFWCEECCNEDRKLLTDLDIPCNSSSSYWALSSNLNKLKAIPKRQRLPKEEKVEAKSPCAVCAKPCKDFGPEKYSVCAECDPKVYKNLTGNEMKLAASDCSYAKHPQQTKAIEATKAELQQKAAPALQVPCCICEKPCTDQNLKPISSYSTYYSACVDCSDLLYTELGLTPPHEERPFSNPFYAAKVAKVKKQYQNDLLNVLVETPDPEIAAVKKEVKKTSCCICGVPCRDFNKDYSKSGVWQSACGDCAKEIDALPPPNGSHGNEQYGDTEDQGYWGYESIIADLKKKRQATYEGKCAVCDEPCYQASATSFYSVCVEHAIAVQDGSALISTIREMGGDGLTPHYKDQIEKLKAEYQAQHLSTPEDKKTSCVVCQASCKKWSSFNHSVCASCTPNVWEAGGQEEMAKRVGKDDWFPDNQVWNKAIEKAKSKIPVVLKNYCCLCDPSIPMAGSNSVCKPCAEKVYARPSMASYRAAATNIHAPYAFHSSSPFYQAVLEMRGEFSRIQPKAPCCLCDLSDPMDESLTSYSCCAKHSIEVSNHPSMTKYSKYTSETGFAGDSDFAKAVRDIRKQMFNDRCCVCDVPCVKREKGNTPACPTCAKLIHYEEAKEHGKEDLREWPRGDGFPSHFDAAIKKVQQIHRDNTQEFWVGKQYLYPGKDFDYSDGCEKIRVPKVCPHCAADCIIDDLNPGGKWGSGTRNACDHFGYYNKIADDWRDGAWAKPVLNTLQKQSAAQPIKATTPSQSSWIANHYLKDVVETGITQIQIPISCPDCDAPLEIAARPLHSKLDDHFDTCCGHFDTYDRVVAYRLDKPQEIKSMNETKPVEVGQDIWVDPVYLGKGRSDKRVKIRIPSECTHCQTKLTISSQGHELLAGYMNSSCAHTTTWYDLAAMRLDEPAPAPVQEEAPDPKTLKLGDRIEIAINRPGSKDPPQVRTGTYLGVGEYDRAYVLLDEKFMTGSWASYPFEWVHELDIRKAALDLGASLSDPKCWYLTAADTKLLRKLPTKLSPSKEVATTTLTEIKNIGPELLGKKIRVPRSKIDGNPREGMVEATIIGIQGNSEILMGFKDPGIGHSRVNVNKPSSGFTYSTDEAEYARSQVAFLPLSCEFLPEEHKEPTMKKVEPKVQIKDLKVRDRIRVRIADGSGNKEYDKEYDATVLSADQYQIHVDLGETRSDSSYPTNTAESNLQKELGRFDQRTCWYLPDINTTILHRLPSLDASPIKSIKATDLKMGDRVGLLINEKEKQPYYGTVSFTDTEGSVKVDLDTPYTGVSSWWIFSRGELLGPTKVLEIITPPSSPKENSMSKNENKQLPDPTKLQPGDEVELEIMDAGVARLMIGTVIQNNPDSAYLYLDLDEEFHSNDGAYKSSPYHGLSDLTKACEALDRDASVNSLWTYNKTYPNSSYQITKVLNHATTTQEEKENGETQAETAMDYIKLLQPGDRIEVEITDGGDDAETYTREATVISTDYEGEQLLLHLDDILSTNDGDSFSYPDIFGRSVDLCKELGIDQGSDRFWTVTADDNFKVVQRLDPEPRVPIANLKYGDKIRVEIKDTDGETYLRTATVVATNYEEFEGSDNNILVILDEEIDTLDWSSFDVPDDYRAACKKLGLDTDGAFAWTLGDTSTRVIEKINRPTGHNKERDAMINENGDEVTLVEELKEEMTEAAYRVAATQATTVVQQGILLAWKDKGADENALRYLREFLESEIGRSLISVGLGHGLKLLPGDLKHDPRVLKLAKEMRVDGMATVANEVIGAAMQYVLPGITEAIKALPPAEEFVEKATGMSVASDKKGKKTRVHTPARVAHKDEHEEQEETSSRANGAASKH